MSRTTFSLFCVIALLFAPSAVAQDDILTTAAANGSFKTLVNLVVAADLDGPLQAEGDFTVFAPTDDAFAKLPTETLEALLKPENRDQLAAILKYHVIAGRVTAQQAVAAASAETLQGESVSIRIADGGLQINNARVLTNDIEAANGIIHVIDAVLLPGQDGEEDDHESDTADAATSSEQEVVVIRGNWDDNIVRDGIVADRIEIRIGGGGTVTLTNVQAREIETSIGGGSSVMLSGSVDRHVVRVSGGAALRAADLESKTTVMTVAGGGDAAVNATELLDVSANGGADVRYVSNDAEIKKQINRYATFRPISH